MCVYVSVYIYRIYIYIYIYWSYTYICICVYIVSFRAGGGVVSFIYIFLNSLMFPFLCPPQSTDISTPKCDKGPIFLLF